MTVRRWLTSSVKRLAEDEVPVESVTDRARAPTLDIIEVEWSGPPFDPLWLADHQTSLMSPLWRPTDPPSGTVGQIP
jgi:hypothetical protein